MNEKPEKPIYDFSEDWEEVQAVSWEWIMWNEEGETVTGWIVDIREEDFQDKTTGESRKNPVAYMATENGKHVRFILPTDLRTKLDALNEKRMKAQADWKDILIRIIYNGKAETSKGYKVKTFRVLAKRAEMPTEIANDIPELPIIEIGDDEVINF